MSVSTRSGPAGPSTSQNPRRPSLQAKVKAKLACKLCGAALEVHSNFRPTAAVCPRCGLHFQFDPQQEPLPVRGMKLRFAEVLEAQRRGRRAGEPLPARPEIAAPAPRRNWLTVGLLAGAFLALAAGLMAFSGLFHRVAH